ARSRAALTLEPVGARRLDFRADRCAQAQKQRQRRESRQSLGRLTRQIAVEQPVGGGAKVARLEIHQQKRKIVELVPAGDVVGKLDRVEQDRLAVDERDVAKVQVAVTAANAPRGSA